MIKQTLNRYWHRFLKEFTWTNISLMVPALSMLYFSYYSARITSSSMEKTIYTGDLLVLESCSETPRRGDILVFYPPEASKEPSRRYIKRCTAVAGDIIQIKGNDFFLHPYEGDTYIKSHYLPEKIVRIGDKLWVKNPYSKYIQHIGQQGNDYDFCHYLPTTTISKKRFFALGDNRDNSYDSRYWGSVPYENIFAKAKSVLFSWDVDTFSFRKERFSKILL